MKDTTTKTMLLLKKYGFNLREKRFGRLFETPYNSYITISNLFIWGIQPEGSSYWDNLADEARLSSVSKVKINKITKEIYKNTIEKDGFIYTL